MRIRLVIGSLIALVVVAPSWGQTPLSTGFTYQGQLKEGGVPLSGTADFEFSLWADPTSQNPGTWLTGAQVMNNVPLVNGLFTVALNANGELGGINGFAAFDGTERFLEIHVDYPAGSNHFVTLTPRQRIGPTPYATFATKPWGATGSDTSFGGGNVGIGTNMPGARLDVRGDVKTGPSGQYFAAGGNENLRLLRGEIAGTPGTVVYGSGFTSSKLGTGHYRITFSTPFAGNPSVTANAIDETVPQIATIDTGGGNASIEIRIWSTNGVAVDSNFMFTVIGPR